MPCASSIEEAVSMAELRWRGFEFRIKNSEEACGPCPIPGCGLATDDGFLIFASGYFFCRPGKHDGWLDDDKPRTLTPEQIAIRRQEANIKRLERKQQEHDRRLEALERMARCTDHLAYHDNLTESAYQWWTEQGMRGETIEQYKLGYCSHCPTDREHRPSYTLPVWNNTGRVLWNIRHRLDGQTADKYRPHIAGLGTQLANTQALRDADYGLIVEGAKKALCISQHGFPAVGVMGKRGTFKVSWLDWFPNGPIYIGLDPDAQENAEKLGRGLAKVGRTVYVASFPCKPDDWFIDGGSAYDFYKYLHYGRRIH
jgi:hypothetical protein